MFSFDRALKTRLVSAEQALPGRATRPFRLDGTHTVLGTPIEATVPAGYEEIIVGMGCFWGAERTFWKVPSVWTTAVGYAGGYTPPTQRTKRSAPASLGTPRWCAWFTTPPL